MKLRHLDLFSGIGGFSLGLESTGHFETVAFCEIEAFPRRVLEKHWPNIPRCTDIRSVTRLHVTDWSARAYGYEDPLQGDIGGEVVNIPEPIDVVSGGFPCQDVSLAGARAGLSGERSGLWSELFRVISEVRPRWAIVENVPGLRTLGADAVLVDLAGAGYAAWPLVVGAVHAGAPHRRQRVWIVAVDKNHMRKLGIGGRGGLQQSYGGQMANIEDRICLHKDSAKNRIASSLFNECPAGNGCGSSEPQSFGQSQKQLASRPSLCEYAQSQETGRRSQTERPQQMEGNHLHQQRAQVFGVVQHRTGGKGSLRQCEDTGGITDANNAPNPKRHDLRQEQGRAEPGREGQAELGDDGEGWDAADTDSARLEKYAGKRGNARKEQSAIIGGDRQWSWQRAPEPVLRGVDDGLPCGVDRRERLKALGNAVVPQIVAAIGRAIIHAEIH